MTTNPGRFAKPEVRAVSAYHLEPRDTPIKLNQNENAESFPHALKEEIWQRVAGRDWARYPDFHLREITQRLAAHADVPEDWVLVGNGSNELLQMTLLTVVGRGDHIIVPLPTFTLYRLQSVVMGAMAHTPLMRAETNFAFPVDEVIDLAQRHDARAIVMCSPNNPTGTAYAEADIRRVIEATPGLVLLDEAYREFNRQDLCHLVRDYDNVVIFRTFSKALAMAGVRVGYCIARPEMAAEIGKVKLPYALNILSEAVTLVSLDHPELFAPTIDTAIQQRDRLLIELPRLPGLTVYPSAANFVLVHVAQGSDRAFQRLLSDGILVRDVSHYPGLSDHLRLSVGTAAENDALLESLSHFTRHPG